MTAAEHLDLDDQASDEIGLADLQPAEPHLHIVTEEDVKAVRLAEASRIAKTTEFVATFATNALTAALRKEPYRTNEDGSIVPTWLYQYRRIRYKHNLRPVAARHERAVTAQTAARTALLGLTAGVGELWPGDLSPA